jgi:hypothetical protein
MSMLNWFSPGKKKLDAQTTIPPSSGLSRMDSTKPHHQMKHGSGGAAQPANRKKERMERRELLYAVVREAMVRASVLSSTYKFKVLSLDPHGRQFMVMVDLATGAASDTTRLAEIEAMVAQSAKARYDILVSAVYWRANEHVAIGDPAHFGTHRPLISQPAALEAHSGPAELREAPVPQARRVEPLQADEVAAFHKALAAGVRGEEALANANQGKADQNYTLLTGFEDTEVAGGADDDVNEHLSGTQYGALR